MALYSNSRWLVSNPCPPAHAVKDKEAVLYVCEHVESRVLLFTAVSGGLLTVTHTGS